MFSGDLTLRLVFCLPAHQAPFILKLTLHLLSPARPLVLETEMWNWVGSCYPGIPRKRYIVNECVGHFAKPKICRCFNVTGGTGGPRAVDLGCAYERQAPRKGTSLLGLGI